MKKLICIAILLSVVSLVDSCKSPSDPPSPINLPEKQGNNARTTAQSYSPSQVKSIIENNLIDKSLESDYEVRQGVLHFRDLDTYLKVRNELRKLSTPDRIKKTGVGNFISLLSLYQEFIDKTNKNESTESYRDIVVQVKKENSNESKLELLNTDLTVAALINRDGLVYIGKILYQFTDKYEEYVLDGDQSKLGTTNQLVQKLESEITPDNRQARLIVADFCRQSWTQKVSTDYQRRVALDVKMKATSYVTGSFPGGVYNGGAYGSGTYSRIECQPTAFGVPYKNGGTEWKNYRTTNHLKSAWSFTATQVDNHLTQAAYDNYEYWNDWNWIDYGGTILTFYNVPNYYVVNNDVYSNEVRPQFQFDGGYYYTDGVPEAQKLMMLCP